MSTFTEAERAYLSERHLGRLATLGTNGSPHVVPVGIFYDPGLDALAIGGRGFAASRKYRDVLRAAATAELARRPEETPDEFAERAGHTAPIAVFAEGPGDLAALSAAYDAARHGEPEPAQQGRVGYVPDERLDREVERPLERQPRGGRLRPLRHERQRQQPAGEQELGEEPDLEDRARARRPERDHPQPELGERAVGPHRPRVPDDGHPEPLLHSNVHKVP